MVWSWMAAMIVPCSVKVDKCPRRYFCVISCNGIVCLNIFYLLKVLFYERNVTDCTGRKYYWLEAVCIMFYTICNNNTLYHILHTSIMTLTLYGNIYVLHNTWLKHITKFLFAFKVRQYCCDNCTTDNNRNIISKTFRNGNHKCYIWTWFLTMK